jgi:hypothetical protein
MGIRLRIHTVNNQRVCAVTVEEAGVLGDWRELQIADLLHLIGISPVVNFGLARGIGLGVAQLGDIGTAI